MVGRHQRDQESAVLRAGEHPSAMFTGLVRDLSSVIYTLVIPMF
jgi:hypothetical protein